MSKIDALIQELCPDGVEYRSFGEACLYVRGVTYSKSDEIRLEDQKRRTVLRANNITAFANVLNFDDLVFISSEVKVKEAQRLFKGDILC